MSLLPSRIALWAIPDPDVVFFLTRKRGREWGEPCLSTVGLFFLINPFPVQSSRRFFRASVSSLERAFGF